MSSPNASAKSEGETTVSDLNLNNFQILEYVAWGISALLGAWMLSARAF